MSEKKHEMYIIIKISDLCQVIGRIYTQNLKKYVKHVKYYYFSKCFLQTSSYTILHVLNLGSYKFEILT